MRLLLGEEDGIFQGQAWNSVSFKFTDLRPEESLSLNRLSSQGMSGSPVPLTIIQFCPNLL